MKKVMPSMSFSEMIKILENFLPFLDFAVSFNSTLLLICDNVPAVRIKDHKLHGSTSVCAGLVQRFGLIGQVAGLFRQVPGLIRQV